MSAENTVTGSSGRDEKNAGNIGCEGKAGTQPPAGKPTGDARAADAPHDINGAGANSTPEWANGLRQLYDSVIEEPIPDSFKDLLAQLNDDGK